MIEKYARERIRAGAGENGFVKPGRATTQKTETGEVIEKMEEVNEKVEKTAEATQGLLNEAEDFKPTKKDTTESLYYGGKDNKLQKVVKEVNGKVVKPQSKDEKK